MIRKLAIALAATAALGAASLSVSSPAQAWGFKHHHSFFGFRAFAPAVVVAPGCYVKRYVLTPSGSLERRLINVCY